jgi:hypothetical protein
MEKLGAAGCYYVETGWIQRLQEKESLKDFVFEI